MITKLTAHGLKLLLSSVLAKIFMVTKLTLPIFKDVICSVLAKILMVTKPQKYGSTFLNVIEY